MSISSVSNAVPQYQGPATPKAQLDAERGEPAAAKAKPADIARDGVPGGATDPSNANSSSGDSGASSGSGGFVNIQA
jgi:hypothetical protein